MLDTAEMVGLKCKKCGLEKGPGEFYSAPSYVRKDGTKAEYKHKVCKDCYRVKIYANPKYIEHSVRSNEKKSMAAKQRREKEEAAARMETARTCNTCGECKPITSFNLSHHVRPSGFRARMSRCRTCYCQKVKAARTPDQSAKDRKWSNAWHREQLKTVSGWTKSRAGKLRAKCERTGIQCNITSEYLESIFPADMLCPALGVEFVLGPSHRYNPSVDRIDPDAGYVVGNVAIISRHANTIKNNATAEEIGKVAEWLAGILQEER